MDFKLGECIEVGIGDSIYDENGYSYYFIMDREGYNELDIVEIFDCKGNVLYVNIVTDDEALSFAGNNNFSMFL